MTNFIKLFSVALVYVPRLIIAIFLTYTSGKFLVFANSMGTVVLKAVAMQFVVTLDETIYKAFIPTTFNKKLTRSTMKVPGARPSIGMQWGMSFIWICLVFGMVRFINHFVLGDFEEFRHECSQ